MILTTILVLTVFCLVAATIMWWRRKDPLGTFPSAPSGPYPLRLAWLEEICGKFDTMKLGELEDLLRTLFGVVEKERSSKVLRLSFNFIFKILRKEPSLQYLLPMAQQVAKKKAFSKDLLCAEVATTAVSTLSLLPDPATSSLPESKKLFGPRNHQMETTSAVPSSLPGYKGFAVWRSASVGTTSTTSRWANLSSVPPNRFFELLQARFEKSDPPANQEALHLC